jgi:hypothetical protein
MDIPNAGITDETARLPAKRVDLVSIGGAGVLLAVLLRPFQPTPFIDDWAYAFPVQHLIDTGTLRIPEYSNPALVHMLYGAVWSLLFGFSFITLGLSTWTLWIALQLGVYALILELGGTRRNALIGAAITGLFPTCFGLASSFMTDVPFLAAETWSTLWFVRALQRRTEPPLWMAALLAGAATGIRMIGLAIPFAMLVVLALHAGSWGRHPRRLVAPLLCLPLAVLWLLVFDAFKFVSADVSYVSNSPQHRMESLPIAFEMLPETFPAVLAEAVLAVGIALVPAALGLAAQLGRRLPVAIIAGGAAALVSAQFTDWIPFGIDNLWVIGEPWGSPGLVPGWAPRVSLSPAVTIFATVGGFTAVVIVLASFRHWRIAASDWFAAWVLVGLVLVSAALWLFNNDRYALVFLPLATAFLLCRAHAVRLAPAVLALLVYGAMSIASAHDQRIYDAALWSTVARLRAGGVPASDINGGYTVNAWLQYVHPEQAHREPDGSIAIPLVNADFMSLYTVSNAPLPGTKIVETVPYTGWYGSGRLYLLQRAD